MPLVHMKDMLRHAYDNAYAVGSFNILSLDFLEGILRAAEHARAPVILGLSEPHFSRYDFHLLMPAMEAAAKRADVPVAIHFDHGSNPELAQEAIALGCNGVMIDASHSPLEENLKTTKQVVDLAHACAVPVEAELGYIPEAGATGADELSFTTVDQARGFVRHTGVDFLAVSVGTVHGRLKGKARLDYQRLRHINDALGIPLVVHGGSGLSDDQYHRLITGGVAKINYHTSLSETAAASIQRKGKQVRDYAELNDGVRDAICVEAEECMRRWGSAGRAAEVISRCRPWNTAEQITLFNVELAAVDDVEMVLSRGRRLLAAIPGVREVSAGHTETEGAKFRFIWRVMLAHADAREGYLHHQNYRDFNHRLLSSLSSDKMASFYQGLETLSFAEEGGGKTVNWA